MKRAHFSCYWKKDAYEGLKIKAKEQQKTFKQKSGIWIWLKV